jgi:hypothetical protein
MGTRGLLGVTIDGEKKWTYNHYDSYPDGLGDDVVRFIQHTLGNPQMEHLNWKKFKDNIKKVKMVEEGSKPSQKEIWRYKRSMFCDLNVSNQSEEDWYCLLRHAQGITGLEQIFLGNLEHMIESQEFMNDSLWCEYAYVIDLDTSHLEVYEGFQKTEGNMETVTRPDGSTFETQKYDPCKLVKSFPVAQIPENWKFFAFPEYYNEEGERKEED